MMLTKILQLRGDRAARSDWGRRAPHLERGFYRRQALADIAEAGSVKCETRRWPTLPPRLQGSTIGAGGLNFRVRNGNGCDPSAKTTSFHVASEEGTDDN